MTDEQPRCSICGEPAVFEVEVNIYVNMTLLEKWDTDHDSGERYHPQAMGSADTWQDKYFCRTHGLAIQAKKYGEKVKISVEGDHAVRRDYLAKVIAQKLYVLAGLWTNWETWERGTPEKKRYMEQGYEVADTILHLGLA